MNKLTEKQQKFAINKAAGVRNREAAIAAGYAANSADVAAAKLMQREDIRKAIKAASAACAKPEGVDIDPMPRKRYPDALTFLADVMNGPKLPVALRVDAAKALMPYQHARMGEVGKKEKVKERADALTRKSRFSPKAPPTLRAIEGGKTD